MKLNRLILFALLFSTGLLNAQSDFRSGFIIKNSGDTLVGKIDYRGDLLMSSICKFMDADNTVHAFKPNDIKAFRFTDSKFFVSKELNGKNVFLEYLIKGKVSVYYMRDEKGDHYYLDNENLQLIEMPYEEGIKVVGEKQYYFETHKHNGILNYYMQDAKELQSQIQSLKKPEHQTLIKLAEDYNNIVCKDEKCIIYEKKIPSTKILIEPFAGVTKLRGYDNFINEFGCFLYISTPRSNERLYFKTGFIYDNAFVKGKNSGIYKLPLQLQYIYRVHRIQPKVSGGYNFLRLELDDANYLAYTLSLNTGLDYKISNKINLSTAFNSDYLPFSTMAFSEVANFFNISYSFIVGLRFDL